MAIETCANFARRPGDFVASLADDRFNRVAVLGAATGDRQPQGRCVHSGANSKPSTCGGETGSSQTVCQMPVVGV